MALVTFSEALDLLREGRSLQREGWHGKHCVKMHRSREPFTDDFLVILTESGAYMPWLASPADVVADDWRVL